MSLVYYGCKVNKDDFWNVVEDIRETYRENHLAMKEARNTVDHFIENPDDFDHDSTNVISEIREIAKEEADHATEGKDFSSKDLVRLQVYDLGDYWTFRILEPGYFFFNEIASEVGVHDDDVEEIEDLSYDGRTDVTEKEEENLPDVERVVEMQRKNEYFLVPALSTDDIRDVYFEEKAKEVHEAGKRHRRS
jgi:hypothetical protein